MERKKSGQNKTEVGGRRYGKTSRLAGRCLYTLPPYPISNCTKLNEHLSDCVMCFYFSSADNTDDADFIFSLLMTSTWAKPLNNPCHLRHLRMKNENAHALNSHLLYKLNMISYLILIRYHHRLTPTATGVSAAFPQKTEKNAKNVLSIQK